MAIRIDLPGDIEPERKKFIIKNFTQLAGGRGEEIAFYCGHGLMLRVRKFKTIEIPPDDPDMVWLAKLLKQDMEVSMSLINQINKMEHGMKERIK